MEENTNNQKPMGNQTFVEHQAGRYYNSGNDSVSIGYQAGRHGIINGNWNIAMGNNTYQQNNGNVFIGYPTAPKDRILDIHIREMSGNGFIVKVGCTEFAFNDRQEMIKYLNDYILDPEKTQAKYREGILFKKEDADIQDFDDELYKEMVKRMKKSDNDVSPYMAEKFPNMPEGNVQNDGDLNAQSPSHPSVSPNLLLDPDRHDPTRQ